MMQTYDGAVTDELQRSMENNFDEIPAYAGMT